MKDGGHLEDSHGNKIFLETDQKGELKRIFEEPEKPKGKQPKPITPMYEGNRSSAPISKVDGDENISFTVRTEEDDYNDDSI